MPDRRLATTWTPPPGLQTLPDGRPVVEMPFPISIKRSDRVEEPCLHMNCLLLPKHCPPVTLEAAGAMVIHQLPNRTMIDVSIKEARLLGKSLPLSTDVVQLLPDDLDEDAIQFIFHTSPKAPERVQKHSCCIIL